MIHCHDKLVTALKTDCLTISGVLFSREFIPEEIHNKMLGTNFTSQEKATIVVNTVIDKIKIAPKRFDELMKIFSEQMCTKDIISSLSSQKISCEKTVEDKEQGIGVVISTNQQYAVCEGHMHKAWVTLHPDDKTDLEGDLHAMQN